MRLAFLATHEKYFGMADLMIDSARKVMPGIHIVHLTEFDGSKHPKADECFQSPEGMEFGTIRMYHQARLHKEWIFSDVDVIFQKDVWHVFDEDFDVAAADRKGTKWEDSRYGLVMPLNNGVVWSRNNDFWKDLITGYDELPNEFKSWGEQLLFNNLVATDKYRVKVLPSAYNFTPTLQDDDVSHAFIVHYKGNRKIWMGT